MKLTIKEKKIICIALAVLALATIIVFLALVVIPQLQYWTAEGLRRDYGDPVPYYPPVAPLVAVFTMLQMVFAWAAFGVAYKSLDEGTPAKYKANLKVVAPVASPEDLAETATVARQIEAIESVKSALEDLK